MSHGDRVTQVARRFPRRRQGGRLADLGHRRRARKFYAMQFHPEVVHTPDGAKLIRKNFVRKVAGLKGDWTMRAFREEAIEKIRAQVGKGG
jgi:GMP synthase (glutamine-hydrolysing)